MYTATPDVEGAAPRGKRFLVVVTAPSEVRRDIRVEILDGDDDEFVLESSAFLPHCGQVTETEEAEE